MNALLAVPAFDGRWLIWPLLAGIGLYLIITAQPVGRPKPDLAERLRRLDVDERVRMNYTRPDTSPMFASRLLEHMLRPLLEDVGGGLRALFSRFGFGGGKELERRLQLLRPTSSPSQFFGEKMASGVVGLAFFPVADLLGLHPFGMWPAWLWLVTFAVGFLTPDWQLARSWRERRARCLMELPSLLDMLTIAASAGLALEQALERVARQSSGVIAGELLRATREAALGQRDMMEALAAMAERNGVTELSSVVAQLRAATRQGIPIVQALSAQAEAIREQKRLRIVEEGGKATERMVVPVVVFILPAVLAVTLLPAALQMTHLSG